MYLNFKFKFTDGSNKPSPWPIVKYLSLLCRDFMIAILKLSLDKNIFLVILHLVAAVLLGFTLINIIKVWWNSLAAFDFYTSCWRRVLCRQCSITCWSKRLGGVGPADEGCPPPAPVLAPGSWPWARAAAASAAAAFPGPALGKSNAGFRKVRKLSVFLARTGILSRRPSSENPQYLPICFQWKNPWTPNEIKCRLNC